VNRKGLVSQVLLRLSVVVLPSSIGFLAVVITLMTLLNRHLFYMVLPLVSIACGLFLAWSGHYFEDRFRFHFSASFLLLSGFLLLLLDLGLFSIPLPSVWPFLMLFVGLSFMISGMIRYRRAHPMFIVPAFFFFALGFLFLLFSTDIIHVSLVSLALWWLPLLLVPTIVSFLLWLFRRHDFSDARD